MGNKIITDEGKSELLRIGFTDGVDNGFTFLALGTGESNGAQNGVFDEIPSQLYGYHRVPTTLESNPNDNSKEITISGVFDEGNYNPSGDGGLISEIGLCNSDVDSEPVFFLYSEVPEIFKNDNISLKYTITISIE